MKSAAFLLSLLTTVMLCSGIQAQTQLPNRNFEEWTTTAEGNALPKHWHSFGDADCQLKGIYSWGCPYMLKNHSNRVAGHTGYGCEIYAAYIAGIVLVNGVLTTGQMQFVTPDTKSAENHNYTDKNNKCGNKAAIPFTGRPDSISFWCKFDMKRPSNQAIAKFFLHSNVAYKDITGHTLSTPQTGKIGAVISNIKDPNDKKWHRYRCKVTYYNEKNQVVTGASRTPSYILATFSTNKTLKAGDKGDKLVIDDIYMIYNKRLQGLNINEKPLPEFNPDVYQYEYAYYGDAIPQITATAQSQNATVRIEQPCIENNFTAQIIVAHDDGEATYQVRFFQIGNLLTEK